jgi:hypothetical protein
MGAHDDVVVFGLRAAFEDADLISLLVGVNVLDDGGKEPLFLLERGGQRQRRRGFDGRGRGLLLLFHRRRRG